MSIRAVLCDIYKTLLDVGPPPPDADHQWEKLSRGALPRERSITLAEFDRGAETVIQREHAVAKAAGVAFPEIFWPAVAREAWPSLASLDEGTLDDFLFAHAQLQRTVRLMPGAADVLRSLSRKSVPLGLVSNSQPYTLRELDAVLVVEGLSRAIFAPDLCFLSFEQGFSKPDPHVFRLLSARLARHGLTPGETLVVGDREDNDIAPARAQGFRTWLISREDTAGDAGGWPALGAALAQTGT